MYLTVISSRTLAWPAGSLDLISRIVSDAMGDGFGSPGDPADTSSLRESEPRRAEEDRKARGISHKRKVVVLKRAARCVDWGWPHPGLFLHECDTIAAFFHAETMS
jgi:hypothetical protein